MKLKTPEINAELTLFCPRRSCPCHQKSDNKITKDGAYITKNDPIPRQMFYCWGGKHRFSETGYSELFGKHGSFLKYEQVAKLSCYGLSSRAIALMCWDSTNALLKCGNGASVKNPISFILLSVNSSDNFLK